MDATVGIIIPTYGHFDYAKLAVESAADTPGACVIVVDDCSRDWPGERIVRGWLPPGVPYLCQRYDHNGGLSRSWNAGLRLARMAGLEYAVCGNSDLVLSRGWWEPLHEALQSHHFAGPVTNAPGHVNAQQVKRYIPDYTVDDTLIDETGARCRRIDRRWTIRTELNGFCFAGRVASFFAVGDPEPFDPNIPMSGNETEFFKRSADLSMSCAIVPQSFVFHYRSVSRGLNGRRPEEGASRLPAGCAGCGTP